MNFKEYLNSYKGITESASPIDSHKEEVLVLLDSDVNDFMTSSSAELVKEYYSNTKVLPYIYRNLFSKIFKGKFDLFESVKMFYLQVSELTKNKNQYSLYNKLKASVSLALDMKSRISDIVFDNKEYLTKNVINVYDDIDKVKGGFNDNFYVKYTMAELIDKNSIPNTANQIFETLVIDSIKEAIEEGCINSDIIPSYEAIVKATTYLLAIKNITVDNFFENDELLKVFNKYHNNEPKLSIYKATDLDSFKRKIIADRVKEIDKGDYFYCNLFDNVDTSTNTEYVIKYIDYNALKKLLNKDKDFINYLIKTYIKSY